MRIRTKKELIPGEDYYALRFSFDEFTDEEKFLFSKYGLISIQLPTVFVEFQDGRRDRTNGSIVIDKLVEWKFLFKEKGQLETFQVDIIKQIQERLRKYLADALEFAGEETYEVTAAGEIRKINEGSRKALDKNSKEYKEIIEKNREAFEKLSKL